MLDNGVIDAVRAEIDKKSFIYIHATLLKYVKRMLFTIIAYQITYLKLLDTA